MVKRETQRAIEDICMVAIRSKDDTARTGCFLSEVPIIHTRHLRFESLVSSLQGVLK